jgi:hypothetical protein
MMLETITGTTLILLVWLLILVCLTGWGILGLRMLKLNGRGIRSFGESFWIGFVLLICFLQIWQLFEKINGVTFLIVVAVGCFSLVIDYRALALKLKEKSLSAVVPLLVIGLIIGFFLANRTMAFLEPISGFVQWDTGSYHLQAVKWNSTYPLIPGLANINHLFGFNSSYFLYASVFDFWIWNGRASYIATGLLLFAMIMQSLDSFRMIFSKDYSQSRYALYESLLIIPLLLKANIINSFETDYPIFMLTLLFVGQLFLFLLESRAERSDRIYRIFFISLIALIGFTIKSSFAIIGFVGLLVVVSCFLVETRRNFRTAINSLLPYLLAGGMLVFIPWSIRSFLLSGYLFFPSTFISINVPWKVPETIAIDELNHIRTVAREIKPGVDFALINGWSWFSEWIKQIPIEIVQVVNLAFVMLLTLLIPTSENQNKGKHGLWLSFLPLIIYFPFWLWFAPAVRFIDGAIWSSCVLLISLSIARIELLIEFSAAKVLRIILLAGILLWMIPITSPLWIMSSSNEFHGMFEYPVPTLISRVTSSGLKVTIPSGNFELRCWDAPLPCVPTFDDRLEKFDFSVLGQNRFGYRLDAASALK